MNRNKPDLEIILADTNVAVYRAMKAENEKKPPMRSLVTSRSEHHLSRTKCDPCTLSVYVSNASVFDFDSPGTALVSPANSFGFMDGGIDALYTHVLGDALAARVRETLAADHVGELLVGEAIVVETFSPETYPFLVVAPTMRVPTILPSDTINSYLAARAALRSVIQFNQNRKQLRAAGGSAPLIDKLVIPGLGTGVGRVSPEQNARQTIAAITENLAGVSIPETWWEAQCDHQLLHGGTARDLQFEEGEIP